MMIFATDLDKTMIYYKKYVNDEIMEKIELVETIEQRPVSYMSRNAIEKLQEVNEKIKVVPTTTRSIKEFNNIQSFKYCEYAIVSNGGTILKDRKPMQEWEEHINKILNNYKQEFDNVINLINSSNIATSEPQILDGKYVFARISDKEKCEEVLNQRINKNMLNYCIQGKKLYVIPKEITKGNAINYLKEKLNSKYLIVAGDSLMDKDMLDIADFPIIPRHGELYQKYNYHKDNTYFVKEGIFAADDIIEKVNDIIEEKGVT